ncbi:MAG: fatty acid hydroxylase [Cyclobacteriaceae bacterium]|nr:fatty acid hydroxylase [Cyclobacteriaceae bacterium]
MNYKAIHDIKPKNDRAGKMFDNPILEKLTMSHAAIPISMLILFGIAFLWWGTGHTLLTTSQYVVLVPTGILLWTLFEYLMHKHMYHMLPTNKVKGWIQYNMHGIHHEYPKDKQRLAMPPLVIIIISFAFLFTFRLLMGDLAYAFTPGFLFGYAGYLCVHYIVHAYQPPKNAFKVLWVNHGIHHYKDPDVAFGVSSPLWDYIFRTLPKKKSN